MKRYRLLCLPGAAWAALTAAVSFGCDTGIHRGDARDCDPGQKVVGGECVTLPKIHLNTVGYLPARPKIATFVSGGGTQFDVLTRDGDVALSGKASDAVVDPDTGAELRQIDFSELDEPGEYYLVVDGVGSSAPFRIGADVFVEPLRTAMLGLYGQRCGVAVEIDTHHGHYEHGACHTAEASLAALGLDGTREDRGGWHDAGDYGKYTGNGAFAVAFLLKAYEHFPAALNDTELLIPERDNDVPDILDEARVELEWLRKTQLEDGSAVHKVTGKKFEGTMVPTFDLQPRFFVPSGTVATADLAAVMALAARIYEPFDASFAESCLETAKRAYAFLEKNPGFIEPNQEGFTTGGYNDSTYKDDRAWAAAELFETTGEEEYLDAFEELVRSREVIETAFDWTQTGNLAYVTYLFSSREGRDAGILEAISRSLRSAGDALVGNATSHGYGRAVGSTYRWGVNGILARTSFVLAAAYRQTPAPEYLDAITLQLDHLFGRNPYGRSYLTGIGFDPPRYPHHRPSTAAYPGRPWPGLLVGGPHGSPFPDAGKAVLPALTWTDESNNYMHNEVAINWNTALVYALVAAQHAGN